MVQSANTDLFNPLVPKADNNVSKSTICFTYESSEGKLQLIWGDFYVYPQVHKYKN